jgi:hypothetical protein
MSLRRLVVIAVVVIVVVLAIWIGATVTMNRGIDISLP